MAAQVQRDPAPAPAGRPRVGAEYALGGDLRYLSHHDELRMLIRALVRARWPLAYSHGFNPLPRLTIPLPRSVGTASDCQWVIADLTEPRDPAELFRSLAATLPAGCTLHQVRALARKTMLHAREALYDVELEAADAERVRPQLPRLRAASALVVQRSASPKKPARPVDIRPYLNEIDLADRVLRMRLVVAEQRSARPAEILNELGLAPAAYQHRLRRAEVAWDVDLSSPGYAPGPHERNSLGEQDTPNQEDQDRT